ncbi:hypothetical protein [Ruegeria sp. HKCCD7255]|uniref:hypothetical protein n=1 Tax=Ruegeria sp. HKCCD7255 TaxID=2683004 RepID=UPI0014886E48|nr:hypothetical protein [Ruegeria sp. HKCCD7255]
MSDDQDSVEATEEIVAELTSKSWEARLEIARQQRAEALAQADVSQTSENKTEFLSEPLEEQSAPARGSSRLERVVYKYAHADQVATKAKTWAINRMSLIVLGAVLCGAFLQWSATKLIAGWAESQELSAVDSRESVVESPIAIAHVSAIQTSVLEPKNPSVTGADPLGDDTPEIALSVEKSDATLPAPNLELDQPPKDIPQLATPVIPEPEMQAAIEALVMSIDEPAYSSTEDPQQGPDLSVPEPPKPVIDVAVSVFVPAGVSSDISADALDALKGGQAEIVASALVGYSVKQTQVRFYHQADAERAGLAAEALGGIARDFTNAASKTQPGHIEVYLEGQGGGRTRNPSRSIEQFVTRLVNEFR